MLPTHGDNLAPDLRGSGPGLDVSRRDPVGQPSTGAPTETPKSPRTENVPANPYAGSVEVGGVKFDVLDARGRHFEQISLVMDGEQHKYITSAMHVLVRINGEQKLPDYYSDLPWSQYTAVTELIRGLGFM